MVFYGPDNAERVRQASDRYYFPPTASTPEITLRVFRGAHTLLVHVQLSGSPPDQFCDVEYSDEEKGIVDSPVHLRPPVPECNFLISPPGSPPVGWEQTHEEPPGEMCLSLKTSSARLNSCALSANRRTGTGKTWEAGLAICPSNEDGILLIPEGEAGACVRVQNWCHRRRVVVAHGSEGWGALDELGDGEWELPSHISRIRLQ